MSVPLRLTFCLLLFAVALPAQDFLVAPLYHIPSNPNLGQDPSAIVQADFNHDGIPDLAISSITAETINVFLGSGDGTFGLLGAYSSPFIGGSLVSGDFNKDGNIDLASTRYGVLTILSGNGDGTFQPPKIYPVENCCGVLLAADVNGDGNLDLVTIYSDYPFTGYETGIVVLLGNGDSTFQAPLKIAIGMYNAPTSVVAGDFNKDGKLDLAAIIQDSVKVLMGNEDGTFT